MLSLFGTSSRDSMYTRTPKDAATQLRLRRSPAAETAQASRDVVHAGQHEHRDQLRQASMLAQEFHSLQRRIEQHWMNDGTPHPDDINRLDTIKKEMAEIVGTHATTTAGSKKSSPSPTA